MACLSGSPPRPEASAAQPRPLASAAQPRPLASAAQPRPLASAPEARGVTSGSTATSGLTATTGGLGWFFGYRFFSSCLPYLPVATVCFLARGLSLGQVLALSAVYCAGTALLGIPLAALADRIGHRRALVLAAVALAVGAAWAALAGSAAAFAGAQIALAAGAALESGADSAYLFERLRGLGADHRAYRRLEARSAAIKLVGNTVGFALGGTLAAAAPSAPFAAGALFAAIAALCAMRLASVDSIPEAEDRPARDRLAAASDCLIGGLRDLLAAAALRRLLILAALCAAMARVSLTTAAPTLGDLGLPLHAIGLLTALGAVAAALAAHHSVSLADRFGEERLLAALPVALLTSTVAIGLGSGGALVALVLVPPALAGLHAPLWRSYLNARITRSRRRATALAVEGTFARLLCAAIAGGLTWLAGSASPRVATLGCAAAAAALLVAVALVPSRRGARRMRIAWAVSGAAALLLLRGPVTSAAAEPTGLAAAEARLALAAQAEAERVLAAQARALAESAAARARFAGLPDGVDEDRLVGELCGDSIASLAPLGRGTTIKFKADLSSGSRAALRPAQSLAQGYFRADIAAYLLSRALQLGTVPPACERSVGRAELQRAASAAQRERLAAEVAWSADGSAPVSAVYWVSGVVSADLEKTRPAWQRLLRQPADPARAGADLSEAAPELVEAAAEGSRLLVWDFVIANWDRWSGANTFRLGRSGRFVWLDNAAGFGRESARTRARRAGDLRRVERFSRQLISSLRQLSDDELRGALAPAGLPDRALDELVERRRLVLDHVDALIARHGEPAVLAFD
jgi:hypothetical protein